MHIRYTYMYNRSIACMSGRMDGVHDILLVVSRSKGTRIAFQASDPARCQLPATATLARNSEIFHPSDRSSNRSSN